VSVTRRESAVIADYDPTTDLIEIKSGPRRWTSRDWMLARRVRPVQGWAPYSWLAELTENEEWGPAALVAGIPPAGVAMDVPGGGATQTTRSTGQVVNGHLLSRQSTHSDPIYVPIWGLR
jgi:hypothetical protein